MVINFVGLPSKCISPILMSFKLTYWSSTVVFVWSETVTMYVFEVEFHLWTSCLYARMAGHLLRRETKMPYKDLEEANKQDLYAVVILKSIAGCWYWEPM